MPTKGRSLPDFRRFASKRRRSNCPRELIGCQRLSKADEPIRICPSNNLHTAYIVLNVVIWCFGLAVVAFAAFMLAGYFVILFRTIIIKISS